MEVRKVDEGARTTYVVVLGEGDEAAASLAQLAKEEGLSAARLTAVGAFQRATVGWFDRQAKDYRRIAVDEQCEVLALTGDVALGPDGTPTVHAHVVLGLSDGTTRGGHLLEGHVWPTLEVVLDEPPTALRKTDRPDIGLALIDLDE
ncbi:MAG TPA: PPC domain-containing DNA-binding protein [Pedococcus sp.]|jgi:predicted DNA-binding protein with PD1-like motif